MKHIHLTHPRLDFWVTVEVRERDGRYMATADLGEDSRDVGVGATPQEAANAARAACAVAGAENVILDLPPSMGAEDFAEFVSTEHRVPGVYFSVGGTPQSDLDAEKRGGPPVPSHHSPFFKIEPEPSITMGVRAMTVAVLELLGTAEH